MSSIMTMGRSVFLLLIALMVFSGCGTPNDPVPFDSDAAQHTSDWVYAKHASVSQENIQSCKECHGEDLDGGIAGVACAECHVKGSPLTLTNCTSCHGNPPNGNVYPNMSLSHPVHNALPRVTNVCASCHSGAGSGMAKHYNGVVDVAFATSYNAKSGAAVLNADGTCSKVSCHGGQTTPLWAFGIMDVDTQCTSCHAYGTSEYNSYNSGEHYFHVITLGLRCTLCHDTAKLAGTHFSHLDTPAMEGPASGTLLSSTNYNGATCTLTCHGTRTW